MEILKIKKLIEKILDNNKAINIISIDLKNKNVYCGLYDCCIRHLIETYTIFVRNLMRRIKKSGINDCKIEGKDSPDWKLVDALDVIVHIFHPEKRSFYDLEKMWQEQIPKEKAQI